MIHLLLSVALAQSLPYEIQARSTCEIILKWYEKEEKEQASKLIKEGEECRVLQAKLPKKYQGKMLCAYPMAQNPWINYHRFHYECTKVIGKINVKEHLFGPMRLEDYCRMNPFDKGFCGDSNGN